MSDDAKRCAEVACCGTPVPVAAPSPLKTQSVPRDLRSYPCDEMYYVDDDQVAPCSAVQCRALCHIQ